MFILYFDIISASVSNLMIEFEDRSRSMTSDHGSN